MFRQHGMHTPSAPAAPNLHSANSNPALLTPLPCSVKRSLNGAVAAAGGPAARRSLDIGAGAAPPLQQLAGCSRKRFEEVDLVSPPMPRKSSRTLLDEQQAADMMSRLALAGGSTSGDMASGAAAQQLMAWEAPEEAAGSSAAVLTADLRSESYP